jgi:general secretion pathway protein M
VWLAASALTVALLWWGLLAPALSILRQAPAQHAALDAQLQTMQALAERARTLKAQPLLSRDDSLRALEQATALHLKQAGALKFMGDQATVTLPATSATTLANWLADVRSNARLTPTEARLTKVNATQATWQGSVVFAINR